MTVPPFKSASTATTLSTPGLPKSLETDSHLEELINQEGMLDLTILGCAYVTLSDKAFTVRTRGGTDNCNDPQHWDQQHVGLVFKLPNVHNGKAHWHCVWAAKTMMVQAVLACSVVTRTCTSIIFLELDDHGLALSFQQGSTEGAIPKSATASGWAEAVPYQVQTTQSYLPQLRT